MYKRRRLILEEKGYFAWKSHVFRLNVRLTCGFYNSFIDKILWNFHVGSFLGKSVFLGAVYFLILHYLQSISKTHKNQFHEQYLSKSGSNLSHLYIMYN